jgi:hypothetical protein
MVAEQRCPSTCVPEGQLGGGAAGAGSVVGEEGALVASLALLQANKSDETRKAVKERERMVARKATCVPNTPQGKTARFARVSLLALRH